MWNDNLNRHFCGRIYNIRYSVIHKNIIMVTLCGAFIQSENVEQHATTIARKQAETSPKICGWYEWRWWEYTATVVKAQMKSATCVFIPHIPTFVVVGDFTVLRESSRVKELYNYPDESIFPKLSWAYYPKWICQYQQTGYWLMNVTLDVIQRSRRELCNRYWDRTRLKFAGKTFANSCESMKTNHAFPFLIMSSFLN